MTSKTDTHVHCVHHVGEFTRFLAALGLTMVVVFLIDLLELGVV